VTQTSVWKGFGIASLLWVPISLGVSYLVMYLGWDKTIHPLIWLPISTIIVFIIAIPYLTYVGKKSK
jgi:Na+-transporting methylmalonyl-CoA/oxaloacetate decarboxylase beta subunit